MEIRLQDEPNAGGVQPVVWTVGHSTRSAEELIRVLGAGDVKLVADVRRFPASRRFPQFNQQALAASLAGAGIDYRHFAELGGRRNRRRENSPNSAWRVEQFNAYADHMLSAEFLQAIELFIAAAAQRPTAILCSEALPERCHRRLISDALVVRGLGVRHLLSPQRIDQHTLTPFACVNGTEVTYPTKSLF